MEKYEFTADWAIPFRENCEVLFKEFAGKQINYLEIGVYEGRSACWMLDNILTHPESRYVGIDLFLRSPTLKNLEPHKEKVTIHEGESKTILPKIKEKFDIIYIDGDHTAFGCLIDSVLCWDMAKKIILWDDYQMFSENHEVAKGVSSFLNCIDPKCYKVLINNYQFGIEKIHSNHFLLE